MKMMDLVVRDERCYLEYHTSHSQLADECEWSSIHGDHVAQFRGAVIHPSNALDSVCEDR